MQETKETTAYKKGLKGRILEVAMKAFSERGIKAVKMDDVAQMLGISKRTLYEIFVDKEELLYQGIVQHDKAYRASMAAFVESATSVMDVIIEAYQRRVVRTGAVNPLFYEDLQKYPKVMKYIDNERERTYSQILVFMQRGVREGYFRHDIDYPLVVQLSYAINRYIMTQHLLSQYSTKQVFANMILVPLRGICTEKGIKAIDNSELMEETHM